MSTVSPGVSAPREKFLLVPFRKFLLTIPEDGPGTYGIDTTGTRSPGLAEAGQAQAKAAELMGASERWVRKLLQRMKTERDRVVVHKLRGRPSNRRINAEQRDEIIRILFDPVYAG